jgi:anaphase-promoting complex subunit 6
MRVGPPSAASVNCTTPPDPPAPPPQPLHHHQDESDQALAAYRTAARLFPGLHTPLLGMGCAYQRMNNLQLAERCLLQAADMCPQDPAVAHELGVLAYRWGRFTGMARNG